MLTEQRMQSNWDEIISLIIQYVDGENRWYKLLSFYNKHESRLGLMPASGKEMYHSAFPGGYAAHVLNVYHGAFKLKDVWSSLGAKQDFTDEELTFVALNHDIGKMGTEDEDHYIPQDDAWRKKNLGELYKSNPAVPFMKDYDRSIFILQSIGVEMSETEYLGIKLHAGLFDKGAESYYIAFSPEYKLRSNLPYIIHQADLMATRIESMEGIVTKPTIKSVIKEVVKDIPVLVDKLKVNKKPSLLDKYK